MAMEHSFPGQTAHMMTSVMDGTTMKTEKLYKNTVTKRWLNRVISISICSFLRYTLFIQKKKIVTEWKETLSPVYILLQSAYVLAACALLKRLVLVCGWTTYRYGVRPGHKDSNSNQTTSNWKHRLITF